MANNFIFDKKESKYYEKLNRIAGKFIKYLADRDICGEKMFIRNYMVKIEITKGYNCYGYINIYYKPSKKQYTLATNEITEDNAKKYLTKLWEELNRNMFSDFKDRNEGKCVIHINI